MDGSPCTISPHSPGWECPLNLLSFGGISWRIWPNVTHSRLTDVSQSFFTYHIYTSKVLKYFRCNGWLSLSPFIPVSRLIVDPKSGISVSFLSIKPGGYVTVWHMRGGQMPSQTLPFWHRYSSRGLKYFSSNGWLSWHHMTSFLRLRVA